MSKTTHNNNLKTYYTKKSIIFIALLLFVSLILGSFAYIDIFKPFTKTIDSSAQSVEILLRSKILAGLSIGMIFLAIGAYIVPLFLKDINTKDYHKELRNGIISAGVFYLMSLILQKLDQSQYVKFALVIVVVSISTLVIINWILSKIASKKLRSELRTAIIGSIVSGILFSILIHFVTIGIEYSIKKVEKVTPTALEFQKKVVESIPLKKEVTPKKDKPKNKK
ncbi:MAG: hypothetical protein L6Q54_07405 [Leptospiraceae bacterium]|nr:hypothetical protein [Leptospiraceae bacterium]MCK6381061.1 hypothetical protein [Leptospiraceae bacterium]NUM40600.1 hypothetical protein [Leptospiraceae bacterium]